MKNGLAIGTLLTIQLFFAPYAAIAQGDEASQDSAITQETAITEDNATTQDTSTNQDTKTVEGTATGGQSAFHEVTPPDDNTVIIYVYRLRAMLGAMVPWAVRLDGNIEVSLKQNTYTVLYATIGNHSITVGDAESPVLIGGLVGGALGAMEMSSAQKKGALPQDQANNSSAESSNRVYFYRCKGSSTEYVARDQALKEMARLRYLSSASSRARETTNGETPAWNVTTAKEAYRDSKISKAEYNNIVSGLKVTYQQKVNQLKQDFKGGVITRPEYDQKVREAKQEYTGQQ